MKKIIAAIALMSSVSAFAYTPPFQVTNVIVDGVHYVGMELINDSGRDLACTLGLNWSSYEGTGSQVSIEQTIGAGENFSMGIEVGNVQITNLVGTANCN